VRQANLAPQLRRTAAEEQQFDTQPLRSPEQVRSIMSALQVGTTRGRIDATKYRAEPPPVTPEPASVPAVDPDPSGHPLASEQAADEKQPGETPRGASFAEAATVSFPAIVNLALAHEQATSRGGPEAAGPEAADPGSTDPGPARTESIDPAAAGGAGDSQQNDVTRPEKDA
jgi:hypothetical protein